VNSRARLSVVASPPIAAARGPLPSAWPLAFWLWALALLALMTWGLGRVPLFDVDEGAFSEATREMLASGDWGHTTLSGEDRFDKPIFIYWLQALSVQALGLNEAALRLPSALAAWGWAMALALFAAPRWGVRAAVAAGSVLATSVGVMLIGRAATADALLNLWLTLAALDLWRALEAGAGPSRHAPLRRAAVWLALGMLTKGPVAWLVPAAAVGVWLVGRGFGAAPAAADVTAPDPTAPRSPSWSAADLGRAATPTSFLSRFWTPLRPLLNDPLAWALLLGLALPWYGYALHRHGMAFVDGFFLRHNLQRYGGALEGHSGSGLYYVALIPVLMLPWSALLLPVLARVKPLWADPLARYLLGWAGFVLVFFSFSGTKLPHYALYGVTPLVLLAGRALVTLGAPAVAPVRAVPSADVTADTAPRLPAPSRLTRITRSLLTAALVLWPLLGLGVTEYLLHWVQSAPAQTLPANYLALLSGPAETDALRWGAALSAGLAALLCAPLAPEWRVAGQRWHDLGFARSAAAAALGLLFMTSLLLPWWGERLQGPVRNAALAARAVNAQAVARGEAPAGCVQWSLHQPSFALYLQQPCPRRAPQVGELALVRLDQLSALTADRLGSPPADAPTSPTSPAWEMLHRERGLALIRWQGAAGGRP
jgi:4-amino-4-deoxy-L-arabinose transferase-like glycosyltransferase